MATTIYFRSTAQTAYWPSDTSDPLASRDDWFWAKMMSSSAGTSTPTTVSVASAGFGSFSRYGTWISDPVSTAVTISSTVTFNVWGYESNAMANSGLGCNIWKVTPAGIYTLIANGSSTEISTSMSQVSFTASPSVITLNPNDRFALTLSAVDLSGGSGYTIYMNYDGSNSLQGDTRVTFAETITFATPSAPTGTTLNLQKNLSSVNITRAYEATTATPTAQTFYTQLDQGHENQVTLTASGIGGTDFVDWWSPMLSSVDIPDGTRADIQVYIGQSSNTTTYNPALRLYKTNATGGSQVEIAETIFGATTSTTGALVSGSILLPAFTINTSERLRLVFFQPGLQAAGYGEFYVGRASPNTASVTFPVTLTTYVYPPAANIINPIPFPFLGYTGSAPSYTYSGTWGMDM